MRLLSYLTLVCAHVLGGGCALIIGDLPPKAHVDAASPQGGQDGGKEDDGSHTEEPHSDDSGVDAGDSAPLPGEDASLDAAPDLPDADPDACDGASERVFFRDGDGDGYGTSASATVGCTSPTSGVWVELGDDCEDDEPDVFPGQTEFFGVGYRPGGTGMLSYDYDCDGSETAGPGQDRAPESCAGLLTCAGGGYVPNDERTMIAGLNAYCGSNVQSFCEPAGLMCQAAPTTTETRYVCR